MSFYKTLEECVTNMMKSLLYCKERKILAQEKWSCINEESSHSSKILALGRIAELIQSFEMDISFWKLLLHWVQNVLHEVECWKQLGFWIGKLQRSSKLKWEIPFGYSLLVLFWFSCITFPEFLVLVFLFHLIFF